MAPSITKNFIYSIFYNLIIVLFPLVTAPYVARVLGPSAIGLVGFAGTYVSYFVLVAKLGSETYGQREVAKIRDSKKDVEKFISEMTSVTIINTGILSIIYIASIFLIPKFYANHIIFFISGLSLFLRPLDTLNWYFKGYERFDFTVSRSLMLKVLMLAALFLFVKSEKDVYIYAGISVFSNFGIVFSNVYFIRKDGVKIKFTNKGLLKHYKPLIILFSSTVAISIYTMLDSFMLGLMTTYSEVSFYNYATTIDKMLLSIVTSLSVVALPRMAFYFKNKDFTRINSLMEKSMGIVSFLAFPMAIGIFCVAPVFVPLFLGYQFHEVIIPTMIMSLLIIAIGFNNLLGVQVLLGLGLDKKFLYSVLVGTISNFLLNLVLIPLWGAIGASISSVIAEFLILAVEIYIVYKYTEVRLNKKIIDVIKSLGGGLLFVPIAYILKGYLVGWSYVIVLIILCFITYLLTQFILKNDNLKMVITSVSQLIHKKI